MAEFTPGVLPDDDTSVPVSKPEPIPTIDNYGGDGSRGDVTYKTPVAGGSQTIIQPTVADPLANLKLVNVGNGGAVFARREGNAFLLRSLKGGSGVNISVVDDEIVFSSNGGGGGTSSFFMLDEVPDPVGQPGKVLALNADADGLEWVTMGAASFSQLSDAPASYAGQAGKVVAVKSDETGVEFVTPSASGGTNRVTLTAKFSGAAFTSISGLPEGWTAGPVALNRVTLTHNQPNQPYDIAVWGTLADGSRTKKTLFGNAGAWAEYNPNTPNQFTLVLVDAYNVDSDDEGTALVHILF